MLDVDGVLANFHAGARRMIRERIGIDIPEDEFTTWDVCDPLPEQWMKDEVHVGLAQPGFAASLQPYPEAADAVERLRRVGEVLFVTTPHHRSDTWMKERENWCCKHLGAQPDEMVHVARKYAAYGHIIVDDKPKNIEKWQAHHRGRTAILWDQPYNRYASHLRRESDWSVVEAVARQIAESLKTP